MKTLLSIILAVAVPTGTALAKHGGQSGNHGKHAKHFSSQSPRGGQGKHFSSRSPRGGHTFSRSGSKSSRGKSAKSGNSRGRNWSGDSWHYGVSGGTFIFIGGFGYPYYWGWYPGWAWSVPYAFNYGYDSYGNYPSYGYDYGYYSDPTYGYGNGSSIAQLQMRLARAGYYQGAIDGIMGPATRRAIRDYERDYGRLTMQ